MKCMSCEANINPKWTHAISSNICPFCGESILEEELKASLSSLKELMDEVTDKCSVQLDTWILANYGYKKVAQPSLAKTEDNKKLLDESEVDKFYERSGFLKKNEKFNSAVEKAEYMKNIVKQVTGDSLVVEEGEVDTHDIFSPEVDRESEIPDVVLQMAESKNSDQVNLVQLQKEKQLQKIQRQKEKALTKFKMKGMSFK